MRRGGRLPPEGELQLLEMAWLLVKGNWLIFIVGRLSNLRKSEAITVFKTVVLALMVEFVVEVFNMDMDVVN